MLSAPQRAWQQRAARLQADRPLVAACYPGLRFAEHEGEPVLEGHIVLDDGCGPPQTIAIKVTFPPNYPQHEPSVYEVGGRFEYIADRHFYPNGRCCLWHWLLSPWSAGDPEGLLRFLEHAVVFFRRQLICDEIGEKHYPGPQLAHGVEGTRQALAMKLGDTRLLSVFEKPLRLITDFNGNELCRCGSGLKYKRCHQPRLQDLKARLTQKHMREVFELAAEPGSTLPAAVANRAARRRDRSRSPARPAP